MFRQEDKSEEDSDRKCSRILEWVSFRDKGKVSRSEGEDADLGGRCSWAGKEQVGRLVVPWRVTKGLRIQSMWEPTIQLFI